MVFCASAVLVLSLGADSPRFHGPLFLALPLLPEFRSAASGDLNADGRLDLVLAVGGSLESLVQDPSDRTSWSRIHTAIGSQVRQVHVADFDYDDLPDAVVLAHAVLFMRGRGDGGFDRPDVLTVGPGPTWAISGDWDTDFNRDLAVATENTVVTLFGDGNGSFPREATMEMRARGIESLDMDGDGFEDIVGRADFSEILVLRGDGWGNFEALPGVVPQNLYWPSSLGVGDLNGDRRDDLAVSGYATTDETKVLLLLSQGDGAFVQTAAMPAYPNVAIEDLDADGLPDVLTGGSLGISFHKGKGDGTVAPAMPLGVRGLAAGLVLASDLDADGRMDVVSRMSEALGIWWGGDAQGVLESPPTTSGYHATSVVAADVDGDLELDIVCNRASSPGIGIYLDPAERSRTAPSVSIPTKAAYSTVMVADLDGDSAPDIVGASPTRNVMVTLRDPGGGITEAGYPVGDHAAAVVATRLNGDELTDVIAVGRQGRLAVLRGVGEGRLMEARMQGTLPSPVHAATGDVDADGMPDVAVASAVATAMHFGAGSHELGELRIVMNRSDVIGHLECGEYTGDGVDDLLVATRFPPMLVILRGGSRSLEESEQIELADYPVVMGVSQVDADGILDIVTVDAARNVSLHLGRHSYRMDQSIPLPRIAERCIAVELRDFDADGLVDLGVLGGQRSYILQGTAGVPLLDMRRGDADGSGRVNMTDPVSLLSHLFQGGGPAICEDPADSNDDGKLDLADALVTLEWLFRGGEAPAAPGPFTCGRDPTVDTLGACQTCSP